MKPFFSIVLSFMLILSLCACSAPAFSVPESSGAAPLQPDASSSGSLAAKTVTLTDSGGESVQIPENPRVVSLYGSYSEAWLLAGGSLVGVTQDAVDERGLDVGGAQVVGTVKEPSAEAIIVLEPDLVILSSDIAAQQDMLDVLENAGLTCLSYRMDTFEDYAAMMEQFCGATGHPELLEETVEVPRRQIQLAKEKAPTDGAGPRVLLMRAFSTGIKAKTDDELAGAILKDLGCENIADGNPMMLEDLSLEEVIAANPDFIFVTTMGNEEKALGYLQSAIDQNPAWSGLTAVKEGRYVVLPKDLFHYKPNHRWGESYEYLGKILYPEAGWD